MPALQLTTNVKIDDVREFVVGFSKLSAETLSKPEKYISVSVRHDPYLSFGGTFEPAFLLTIGSLGNISPEKNEVYSKTIFDYLGEKLGVPGDRAYIIFNDPGNAYIGHEGTTFATIFGRK